MKDVGTVEMGKEVYLSLGAMGSASHGQDAGRYVQRGHTTIWLTVLGALEYRKDAPQRPGKDFKSMEAEGFPSDARD